MITREQLRRLGYVEKPDNIKMHDGSTDYHSRDSDQRPYLVNLSEGMVCIVHPNNSKKKSFSTNDIEEFECWHNNFQL